MICRRKTPMLYRIVAFGDSMTRCSAQLSHKRWPFLLQAKLNSAFSDYRFKVINAGIGGNTSREGLARIEADVLVHHPNLTLVEFGGNDASTHPEKAVSFMEYEHNLGAIAKRLRAAGSAIAWLTFPPVIDLWHQSGSPTDVAEKFLPCGGINQYINEYRRRTRSFAEQSRDLFIDLYEGIRKVLDNDHPARFIRADGVHFTDLGSALAAEIVFQGLIRQSNKRVTFRCR